MWHEPQVVIDTVKRRWPLWVVLIGLWISVVFCLTASIRRNAGVFTYALDDAYIHLAIAKHFVQDGVWGATRYGFSASTSSPGWTLLLSGVIALFGRPEVWPLILNVLFATALLVVVDRLLVPSLPNPFPRFWALLFITLIVPLPILIFSGMEHVLHLLLIATVFGLLWRYEANPLESPRITRWLLVTAMLATLIRYETCFLVGPLVLYYAWRHDWRMTIGLAGAVSIGPVIIGLVQVSHGWYFLPNSLLAKSAQIELTGSGLQALAQRVALQLTRSAAPFVLMLVVAGWIIARQRRRVHGGSWSMGLALSFVAASVAQYILAQVGLVVSLRSLLNIVRLFANSDGRLFPGPRAMVWHGPRAPEALGVGRTRRRRCCRRRDLRLSRHSRA